MKIPNFTDKKIESLILAKKTVLEKGKTTQEHNKYKKRNIKLKDDKGNFYQVYLRQNIENEQDFSCGLSLVLKDKTYFTLMRCNGNSHIHTNKLEKETLKYCFHIHQAKEKYIQADKKANGFATQTDKYKNIEGAYQYLLKACYIQDKSLKNGLFGVDIWN